MLSAEVVDDKAKGSLDFEWGNWSAASVREAVDDGCVRDVSIASAMTWVTFVDIRKFLRPFVFPQRLLRFFVLCEMSDECYLHCKFVNDFAWRARSSTVALFFKLQYECMPCQTDPCSPSMQYSL